ncbi:MAG TPA: maleylpyruvate isomerase N-terminal domain-containing protein [Terriglobales bacterium]|nr:maleylpyruvate isomerase N-terminal domain-containing protein [Terriglobales bacterium]
MSADRGYVKGNDAERARLKAFVSRASDADLARPVSAGWTVAGVLGHLAFWDQRIVELADAWQRGTQPPVYQEADIDWINDAAKPFLLAVPPRKAAELALAIAEEADRRVAALTDAQLAANAAAGSPLNLDRAEHRREHLDEIEALLKR